MPQGKMKVKAKIPDSVKTKRKAKGPPISKRINHPTAFKKGKNDQVKKLKKIITKTVNANAEEQLRSIALDGKKSLFSKSENSNSNSSNSKKKSKKK